MALDDRPLTRDDIPFPLTRTVTGQDLLRLFPLLLQPLWSRAAQSLTVVTGTVSAVNVGPPKTVTVTAADGSTFNARYYTSYTPAVGDKVEGVTNGNVFRIFGALA